MYPEIKLILIFSSELINDLELDVINLFLALHESQALSYTQMWDEPLSNTNENSWYGSPIFILTKGKLNSDCWIGKLIKDLSKYWLGKNLMLKNYNLIIDLH